MNPTRSLRFRMPVMLALVLVVGLATGVPIAAWRAGKFGFQSKHYEEAVRESHLQSGCQRHMNFWKRVIDTHSDPEHFPSRCGSPTRAECRVKLAGVIRLYDGMTRERDEHRKAFARHARIAGPHFYGTLGIRSGP